MLSLIDATIAALAVLALAVAMHRYWRLVDEEDSQDLLPDPVLLALLQAQPERRATAAPAPQPG